MNIDNTVLPLENNSIVDLIKTDGALYAATAIVNNSTILNNETLILGSMGVVIGIAIPPVIDYFKFLKYNATNS